MKDASPRIFRNLEKTGGRDGFDTIVGAAVLSYGSLRSPNENQARDFGRLVLPLWDKVSAETRRSLAAALSSSPRVPRELVERLMAEPIEVSAPFLLSSPALGEADIKVLAASRDARLRKLIAGRLGGVRSASQRGSASLVPKAPTAPSPEKPSSAALEAPIAAGLAPSPAAPIPPIRTVAPDAPLASRRPVVAPPLVPNLGADLVVARGDAMNPAATRGAADLVRETLRRLASAGRRRSHDAAPMPTLRELVGAAVAQDADGFYDRLSRMLALPDETVAAIEADDTGERLAIAAKALGAGPADALTMLMMLKPRIGLDVEAFERMTRYYRALKAADCLALSRAAPRLPVARSATTRSRPEHPESVARAETRPSFGRRQTRPGENDAATGKGKKTG